MTKVIIIDHTVDNTKTVTVTKNEPEITTVVAESSVTVTPDGPAVSEIERASGEVDVVFAGQQGPRGPQGPKGAPGGLSEDRVAATVLGGHRMVRSHDATLVGYADNADASHGDDTIGMTVGASVAGGTVEVQRAGPISFNGWSWVPGEPVFLSSEGTVTQFPPDETDAAFLQIVGHAEDATTLYLRIEPPIYY